MAIPSRRLRVEITFPTSFSELVETIVIDNTSELDILVQASKNVLILQNSCNVTISGLIPQTWHKLLTTFTAWNYRKTPLAQYATIKVSAAYKTGPTEPEYATVFYGDIVKCSPVGDVPNFSIEIEAYTQQIDRSGLIATNIPSVATVEQIVKEICRITNRAPDIRTKFASAQLENFGAFLVNTGGPVQLCNVHAMLVMLNAAFRDQMYVWVDDQSIYVRDIYSFEYLSLANVTTFIEKPPAWNEWGVTFRTLFNSNIRLAGAVNLDAALDFGVNGTFIVTQIDYDLSARQQPFYMTVKTSPGGARGTA